MILEKIKKPNDIHKVSLEDFPRLAEEIRSFLIQSVSETGVYRIHRAVRLQKLQSFTY